MIMSFKSKVLQAFFEGKVHKINPDHHKNINLILNTLVTAVVIDDCDMPGKRLHYHKGKDPKVWSLDVNGNFRVLFEFRDGNAYNVDYDDPH